MTLPDKVTAAYPHPANVGFCEYTGLPITAPPEWIVTESAYACRVGALDDCVIFSLPWGRGSESGIRAYLEIVDQILRSRAGRSVIIDDFSHYHGISQRGRRAYIEGLKLRPEVAGIIAYNLSPYFRFNLDVGRRLHLVPYPVEFARDYKDAIRIAARVLNRHVGRITPEGERKPQPAGRHPWEDCPCLGRVAAGDASVAYYRVADDVLLFHLAGVPTITDTDEIIAYRRWHLDPHWGPSQWHYVIAVVDRMGQIPLDVLRFYAATDGPNHERLHTKLVLLVGERAMANTASQFAGMGFPVQVIDAKSFEEAIAIITNHRAGSAVPVDLALPPPAAITSKATLTDALVDVLVHMRWDVPGVVGVAERYPPGHELRTLLDALDSIKTDIDMMLSYQRTQLVAQARTQRALEASEGQFRALFDLAHDGILVVGGDGAITDCNPGATVIFRTARDAMVGRTLDAFIPDAPLTPGIPPVDIAAPRDIQIAGVRDGQFFPMRLSVRTMQLGAEHKTIIYARDVTEQLTVQQAMVEAAQHATRRIGADLHDSLGQKLVGMNYLSQSLVVALKKTDPDSAEKAELIHQVLVEAIGETRALARGLNPAEGAVGGLVSALTDFAGEAERLYAIACVVDATVDEACISAAAATHLYHIVQESVSNAVRHGEAKAVTITLTGGETMGLLTVLDDGCGFQERPDSARRGMGLLLMNHRSELMGGKFSYNSSPGEGVELTCSFALAPRPSTGNASGMRG